MTTLQWYSYFLFSSFIFSFESILILLTTHNIQCQVGLQKDATASIDVDMLTEKTAKIVIAHHPYEATRDDEISFVKDEVIKVTDESDPDWWVGKKKDGSLGFFPSNVSNLN